MGVLVGTSLIVIIPEGIEAVYLAGMPGHTHSKRAVTAYQHTESVQWAGMNRIASAPVQVGETSLRLRPRIPSDIDAFNALPGPVIPESPVETAPAVVTKPLNHGEQDGGKALGGGSPPKAPKKEEPSEYHPPTFYIGLSLIMGFVLMFLIDKLPRHASETLQQPPPTRHISLNNLSESVSPEEEESESFLQSLTPNPKQTRSLATTTGLVIHAAADGIAMGASASTSNTKLGFIIFIAIMVHKAPAAFGLTSVLLKQGLSKRATRGHLIIFSLAAPVGALSTWILVRMIGGGGMDGENGQWWTGMLLLFSAGTFL